MVKAARFPQDDGTGLSERLARHFGCDPVRLPVVQHGFHSYERPNVHLAIQDLLAPEERETELIGVIVPDEYRGASLSMLSRPATAAYYGNGPVEYFDVPLADNRRLACVKRGLYLFVDDGRPAALLLSNQLMRPGASILVEVMATDRARGEKFIRDLADAAAYGAAFRGEVLSLELDCYGRVSVRFHRLPEIRREDLILPEAVLARIERHTISFSRHAPRLRAAGRHLKRGVLLHGPPGTGKTLSAMYLASQMEGRTVIIMTGAGMGAMERACLLGRMLEPATLILEDVDLIATQRQHQTVGANAILFELLNQMDGLSDDVDILFLLTTNRPDIIEPALASRPGRIDQAIEIPLPDEACRRRLFDLYGAGMHLELNDLEGLVRRTSGVSGAFIRELLRKAAVLAAEDSPDETIRVTDRHLEEALKDLLIAGGALTQSLLGVQARSEEGPETRGAG